MRARSITQLLGLGVAVSKLLQLYYRSILVRIILYALFYINKYIRVLVNSYIPCIYIYTVYEYSM